MASGVRDEALWVLWPVRSTPTISRQLRAPERAQLTALDVAGVARRATGPAGGGGRCEASEGEGDEGEVHFELW